MYSVMTWYNGMLHTILHLWGWVIKTTWNSTYPRVFEIAEDFPISPIQGTIWYTKKFCCTFHVNFFVLDALQDASNCRFLPELLSCSESKIVIQLKDGVGLQEVSYKRTWFKALSFIIAYWSMYLYFASIVLFGEVPQSPTERCSLWTSNMTGFIKKVVLFLL